jgi:glutamate synthase (ferredoxin)
MRAREELMQSDILAMTSKLFPIILDGKSDSASMDMVIELLMTGRSLPEVMMMVVPEAWEKHQTMSDDKKHSTSIMLVWSLGMALPLFRLLMEM